MEFEYSTKNRDLCRTLRAFMEAHVARRHAEWRKLAKVGEFPLEIVEPLKRQAFVDRRRPAFVGA